MMLEHLRPYISVPKVIGLNQDELVMEYIPNDGSSTKATQIEIADALAALHRQSTDAYGFDVDTTIGPFRQPNGFMPEWVAFYREKRVLDFAQKAFEEHQIDHTLFSRIERFADDFDNYLLEPERPSLLHGDIWGGNVLTNNNRFTALIDPAVYYGHVEVELAFIMMFHTFGDDFFSRYREHIPIVEGFFEERAAIYQLYPYLVHIRAFGGSYRAGLESIVGRFGY